MVRLLHVTIFEGVGTVSHKEPYACAELLDITGRPIKKERVKTSAATPGARLVWGESGSGGSSASPSPTARARGGSTAAEVSTSSAGTSLTLGRKHDLRNVGALPTLRLSLWGREMLSKDKPLGVALVDLASLPNDGSAVESWQGLEPATGMDGGLACGSLKVSLRLDEEEANRIFYAGAAGPEGEAEGLVVGVEDGPGDEDEEYAELDPNLLLVRVRRAKSLIGLDVDLMGAPSSDPTETVEKDLSPTWDETFEFAVKDFTRILEVQVFDADVVVDESMGSFTVKLEDLLHKRRVTRWYRLLGLDELYDEENPLGELEMSVQWFHDPRAKEIATRKLSLLEIVQRTLGFLDHSSDTHEDDDEEGYDDESKSDAKSNKKKKKKKKKGLSKSLKAKAKDKAQQAREAEEKKMQDELMDIEVKSGDYTIYVHIIEARDLKAEDLQGTSDPVVYVEAFGQKFATEVKPACLSCVFDETFVIGLRNLDKDVFEEGVIKVSVMDADGPVAIKNDLIGSYSFDAANVYFHKDHELHRQWVALVDDENPRDSGTQGYLQLSIAIVGPGDKLKVHDEAEDRRKEREAEAKSGGIDGLVMVPPSVTTRTQWLVTTVWRAEYLPVMDSGPLLTHGGDFYTMVTVSGGAPARTKAKSMYGNRSSMQPVWRTQLWVPVSIPCMSGSVKTIVKDFDSVGDDETVACVNCKLKEIESLPESRHRPQWFPLYGAPLVVPTSTEIADIAKRMTSSESPTNWRTMYENLPQKASTYRGRILLSREIREHLPIGREESTPWRRKVGRLPKKKEPSTTRYAMRCYVATGADVPVQPSVIRMGLNFRMSVRISIGAAVLETRAVENLNGVCEWGELLESKDPIVLPSDPAQMPDAIVHLQRGEDKVPICFLRIPAKELVEQGMDGIAPRWLLLGEDKVLDCLPEGQYPGSLLIKLGLGTLRQFSESAAEWQAEALRLRNRTSYLLRVHVYQGRDLPAADTNGLMDPFLKMQCQGEKLNTEEFMYLGKAVHRRRETVDPMWYFTWEADLSLPELELQRYFPQVSIQLMDWDPVGANDYAGCLFLDLGACRVEPDQGNIPHPGLPTWTPFFLEKPGDSSGELLVSYQLIKTTRPGLSLAPPPDLTPKLRPAFLEILALGIRGMQPYEMLPMQMPYMQLEVDLPNGKKVSLTTNPSKKPSGADANFLERLTVPLELPVEDIFAPRLKLCVRDVRLGGFLTPVVAVGAVSLAEKLPWSTHYQLHSSRRIGAMELMQATGAPVFETMFDQGQGGRDDATGRPSAAAPAAAASSGAVPPSAAPGARNVIPNGGTAGGAAVAGGALGASWGGMSSGPETQTANPMFGGTVGGGGAGAAVGQEPPASGGKTAALGDVPAPEVEIVEMMGQEDEGAGVFGAILHEPVVREKVWSAARQARGGRSQDEDEDDGPPKYMVGRSTLEAELERDLATKPFETYELFRGQKFGGDGGDGSGGDYREVGRFKCVIRVTEGDPDNEPMFAPGDKKRNEEILNELLLPKGYKLRLYCLQALNLTPMDIGIGGRPGKSDPYLKVKLGKEVFSDVDNYIDDVTDADLYRCVELNCELPGASQLQIDVMDYDDIGGDELIGRTVIDLEDRWFDQRWQALGMEHRVEDMSNPDKMRWQVKPLENRSLYVPTSNAPQGVLQCWVDIMPPGDAKGFPPADVALPPDVEFEVRLVIWKCKDVVAMDFASGLNDLFVKAWLEGCEPQETDTHWRAKGGKGSFNWRMKFPVLLGPRARSSKFPYLTLQARKKEKQNEHGTDAPLHFTPMWDKDFLYNDCIAEGMLDLGKHFRRAYKKKTEVLKLFESVHTERAKEALVKTQQALKSEQTKALKDELATQIPNPLLGEIEEEDVDDDSVSDDAEVADGRPGGRRAAADGDAGDRGRRGGGGCCCFCSKKPMTPLELRAENDRRRTLGMPLLDEEEGLTAKEARERRKEEGDEEVRELLQKFKVMAGLSSDDPPDSKWISLEKTDKKTGKKTPMGKCLIGIQIYPAERAEAQPAGMGRSEPNDSPFLPPPNGRLQFGWNPISMISQLLGPRLCAILCCCLCCGLIVVSLIVFQPLWNLLIALAVN
eukprot:g10680.t1